MGNLIGAAQIALASLGFGAMALCANLAYREGVDTASLLMLRFVLASIVLGLLAARGGTHAWPTRKAALAYVLMGCVYALMAWSYFSALRYAASSTVALVLYTFPVMVAIAAALLGLDRFGLAEGLAVAGAVLGMGLMLGTNLSGSGAGFALAFTSALCYASYILLGSKVQSSASPIAASTLVLASAAVIFTLLATWRGIHLPTSATGWAAVVVLALFSTALAIAAFVAGLGRVGPTLAAILSTLEPVVTIGIGITFLHETLQGNAVLGGVLILGSAIGLTLARMRRGRDGK